MTFFQRLRYYIIGFSIGIVLCVLLFGQRGCDWTPGNRVLKQIATSQILITDSLKCLLHENKIDEDAVFKLLSNGTVLFDESTPQGKPKRYVITDEDSKFKIEFLVRNDSVSIIHGIPKGVVGKCTGFGQNQEHIFDMPEKTIKRILKTTEVSASDSIIQAMHVQKIKDGDIYNMIEGGKIDFTNSLPSLKPHPVYIVRYKKYEFELEMAEKKTRVLRFTILK